MRTLLVVALVLASCAEEERVASRYAVSFMTESDPGVPLAGVEVFAEGRPAGQSLADGLVQMYVSAPDGAKVNIEYKCPEGYRHPGDNPTLQLRHFESLGREVATVLELTLRCPPQERTSVFVVRAENGGGLPVFLDGEEVAKTNEQGVAHFAVARTPGTEYRVRIDTTSKPRLSPQDPVQQFTVLDEDALFTVGQEFQRPARKRRRVQKIQKLR